jgi:hypothetical protein
MGFYVPRLTGNEYPDLQKIAHLVSSVIYHADRDKGKCDLHGERNLRRCFTHWTVRAAAAGGPAWLAAKRGKRRGAGVWMRRPARPEIFT